MSRLDDLTIEMIAKNMQYIKHGLSNNKSDEVNASWLFYLIKSYAEDVDSQQRAAAIAERKRLNGSGYAGKASH